jgi:hypothetical protein
MTPLCDSWHGKYYNFFSLEIAGASDWRLVKKSFHGSLLALRWQKFLMLNGNGSMDSFHFRPCQRSGHGRSCPATDGVALPPSARNPREMEADTRDFHDL